MTNKSSKSIFEHQCASWSPESPGASPAAPSWNAECPLSVIRPSGPPFFSIVSEHQLVVQYAGCFSPPPHTYDSRSTGKGCFNSSSRQKKKKKEKHEIQRGYFPLEHTEQVCKVIHTISGPLCKLNRI